MSTRNHHNAANEPESSDKNADRARACDANRLEAGLREAGARLFEETKGLREEVTKQARLHPLATFGIAFTAGLLVARALRRQT